MSTCQLHVIALPHTATTKEYLPCAYTQKVLNWCRMMTRQGWNVIHYGTEGSTVEAEHVTIITVAEQRQLFGDVNWKAGQHFNVTWNPNDRHWVLHNFRAVEQIKRRIKKGDFICVIGGNCQQPISAALPEYRTVEWGIGYTGVYAPFQVYESYAWMHCLLGRPDPYKANGSFYHAVIPNSFPAEDFALGKGDGGYALYIGRLHHRKGVQVAIEACKEVGIPLKIAGQGGKMEGGKFKFEDKEFDAAGIDYVGVVDVHERNALMGGAIATLVPTLYVEPFGGVAVESQLCGTPTITTDWGAFVETVSHGVTGFRCHTLGEFVWALRRAKELDRSSIRRLAQANWSLDAVAPRYDAYFKRLQGLDGKGWYTVKEECEV